MLGNVHDAYNNACRQLTLKPLAHEWHTQIAIRRLSVCKGVGEEARRQTKEFGKTGEHHLSGFSKDKFTSEEASTESTADGYTCVCLSTSGRKSFGLLMNTVAPTAFGLFSPLDVDLTTRRIRTAI